MADCLINVIGNITADPEVVITQHGTPRCKFGLALNRSWFDEETQDWKKEVSFVNVVCWQDTATHVGQSVKKGDRLNVTGRLGRYTWTMQDGNERSVIEINADDVAVSLRYRNVKVIEPEPVPDPAEAPF